MAGSLMMHTGDGARVTLADVHAVETPLATSSYFPVPYGDFLGCLDERIEATLGQKPKNTSYGLSCKGQQLFGVHTFDRGGKGDRGLAVGFRTSHNYSLSGGVASGMSVFVCDNLVFDGQAFVALRRHTINFWSDFVQLVDRALMEADDNFAALDKEADALAEIGVDHDDGYKLIGLALGRDVLTPRQANVAIRSWRDPPQEDWKPRHAWSLYNAFTEAGKRGTAGDALTRFPRIHSYFRDVFNVGPQKLDVIDVELVNVADENRVEHQRRLIEA